jgi:predicted alpha/beta-hydrolase family hydrolase
MDYLVNGPETSSVTILLAHGAGAPMDSLFMDTIAAGLAEHNLKTIRFEFPYMQERRQTGTSRPPNTARVLQAHWLSVIEEIGNSEKLIIGGKSMGGRLASMIADQAGVGGLICLGYPFHAPGKPENPRISHLEQLTTPTLVLQGTRDRLGSREEIAGYVLSPAIRFFFLEDGDHSFKPRKNSGRTAEQNMNQAVEEIGCFVQKLFPA